ncbi:MAG: histidine kinase N-terminal 7TM domain-containing protein [Halorientalis sp.]
MVSHSLLSAFLLAVSALVTAGLAVVLWHRSGGRARSADGSAALVQVAILCWTGGQIVLLATLPAGVKWGGFYLSEFGVAATGPLWLLFALAYTGHTDLLTRRRVAAVGATFLGLWAVVVTNPSQLYLTDVAVQQVGSHAVLSFGTGPLRWLYAGVIWTFHGAGNYFLFRKAVASRNAYRSRTVFLLAANLAVVASTVVSLSPFDPVPYLSLGPMVYAGFAVGSMSLLVGYRTAGAIPVDRLLAPFSDRSKALAPAARDVIMEEMDSGVLVLDHENRLVDVNPLGRQMVGAPEDRIIGKRLTEVVDPSVYRQEPTFLDPETTDDTFSGVWVDTPDGEERCYDFTVSPLGADDGATGRVFIVHDVTDRERRKRALEQRTEQLREQNDRLENFASVVSHDLRNPLNVASEALALAEERDDPEFFQTAREAHDRMETIIEEMLALARQGQAVEDTTRVTLGSIAETAWDNVDTGDASLAVHATTTLSADRSRLLRALENLFRNAVEHAAGEAGHVTVTVGPLEDGFYVEDDGPGIPEDRRDEVLQQGFTTSQSGTGLGLAIVKTIVDAHGWDVTVTESADGGARFEITGISPAPSSPSPEQHTA